MKKINLMENDNKNLETRIIITQSDKKAVAEDKKNKTGKSKYRC